MERIQMYKSKSGGIFHTPEEALREDMAYDLKEWINDVTGELPSLFAIKEDLDKVITIVTQGTNIRKAEEGTPVVTIINEAWEMGAAYGTVDLPEANEQYTLFLKKLNLE